MAFSSFSEFFAMGGHGPYVWSAWGVTALLMLVVIWHARLEHRQLLRGVKRRVRREKAHHHTPQPSVHSAQGDVRNDA